MRSATPPLSFATIRAALAEARPVFESGEVDLTVVNDDARTFRVLRDIEHGAQAIVLAVAEHRRALHLRLRANPLAKVS